MNSLQDRDHQHHRKNATLQNVSIKIKSSAPWLASSLTSWPASGLMHVSAYIQIAKPIRAIQVAYISKYISYLLVQCTGDRSALRDYLTFSLASRFGNSQIRESPQWLYSLMTIHCFFAVLMFLRSLIQGLSLRFDMATLSLDSPVCSQRCPWMNGDKADLGAVIN
jgi:hypothetical protein